MIFYHVTLSCLIFSIPHAGVSEPLVPATLSGGGYSEGNHWGRLQHDMAYCSFQVSPYVDREGLFIINLF